MKKLIVILVSLFFIFTVNTNLFGQVYDCQNNIHMGKQPYHTMPQSNRTFNNDEPYVFNVLYHYADDISVSLNENDFLRATAFLNIQFNQFKIFFKYRGYDNSTEDIPTVINIHLTNSTEAVGVAYLPDLTFVPSIYVPSLSFVENHSFQSILAHEMGHIFGLEHTFYGSGYISNYSFNNFPQCNGSDVRLGNYPTYNRDRAVSENVTRDINNDNYNADVAGDFVIDTPASYKKANMCNDVDTGNSYYLYSDEIVDFVGTPYQDIDSYNFMSYNDPLFLSHFSVGQGVRMRQTIENVPGYQNFRTTVASLYEPYKGFYSWTSEWDNFSAYNTYASYWANAINDSNPPLFQPGFDYEFVNCAQCSTTAIEDAPDGLHTEPAFYNDLICENSSDVISSYDKNFSDYNQITQPNSSAIRILQLDTLARRCYSLQFKPDIDENPKSGRLIKFNDNMINNNTTIEYKDSLQINNPNFIQNLNNGLYKLEKKYSDDSKEEHLFYKNN